MELYRMLTMNIRHTIYTICQSIKTMAIGSLLCLAVQSCRQETHPLIPEDPEEVPISMNATSVEAMETSRALVDSDVALQNNELGLGVYGYKLFNGTKTLVFDNERVYYSSGWKYDNTKYWDKAATEYRFVAYSPHSTSNIRYNTNNHTLTISNIPYWQVINGSEVDYLVATSSGSADHYLTEQQASTAVNFTFSHILSQLVINIKKDEKLSQTYLLKQVEYLNVPQGGDAKATYTLSQEGTATMSDIILLGDDATLTQFTDANGQTVTTSNIPLSHLVVPFTLTDDKQVQVKVTYTVEGTPRAKTVDTGITQLDAGKRYELTLTFKGAEIVPSLEIKKWEDVTVDEDPKYNW